MALVRDDLRELVGSQQHSLVREKADEIDQRIQHRLRALTAAAETAGSALSSGGREDSAQWFVSGQAGLAVLFDDLFFFAADGTTLARHPFAPISASTTVADRRYFSDTVAGRRGLV